MAWKTHEFQCSRCGHEFEEFYHTDSRPLLECPACFCMDLVVLCSASNLATFSMMSGEQQIAHMKKRSSDHTQKQIDKEPERWGDEGMARRSKKIQG